MAIRLSELERSRLTADNGVSSLSIEPHGVGAIALVVQEESELAKTYRGPATLIEMDFSAIPGLRGTISTTIKFGGMIAPALKQQLLRHEIWQDVRGTVGLDRYVVRVWYAGTANIPDEGLSGTSTRSDLSRLASQHQVNAQQPVPSQVGVLPFVAAIPVGYLIGVAVALGVLTLFGMMTWKMSKLSFGEIAKSATLPLLALGALAIGAVFLMRKA